MCIRDRFDAGTAATWNQGDFTYDGVVDILDAADFMSTGLFDAGPYGPQGAAASLVAVPEPALGLAALTAAGLAVGRRRHRRGPPARSARRPA